MTAIAGLIDNGKVWIGGDSAAVDGAGCLSVRSDPKVFTLGPYVIGFTTSYRMGQLLMFAPKLPMPAAGSSSDLDHLKFMVTEFVPVVSRLFKANDSTPGMFLIGYADKLFRIDNDFQVGVAACGYDAVGVGELIVKGSLHTSAGLCGVVPLGVAVPQWRIERALTAAEQFNANVRGPFVTLST